MKAIRTQYLGPTNTRGSRIKATAEGGHSISVPFGSFDDPHKAACDALRVKLGWGLECPMVSGGLPDGSTCWVFVPVEHWPDPPAPKVEYQVINREGLTYLEWLAAAVGETASEDDRYRKAWREGEDPTDFRVWIAEQSLEMKVAP